MASGHRGRSARWGLLGTIGMALRAATAPGSPSLSQRLAALPRLLRAVGRGDYRHASAGQLLGMLAALLYVLSPVDIIPEAVFGVFGIVDDAMVATWLARSVVEHTDAFLAWESAVARGHGQQDAPGRSEGYSPGYAGQDGAPSPVTVPSHVVR